MFYDEWSSIELEILTYFENMQEAKNNDNGRAPHSAWRNYDDFNEYFWYASQKLVARFSLDNF